MVRQCGEVTVNSSALPRAPIPSNARIAASIALNFGLLNSEMSKETLVEGLLMTATATFVTSQKMRMWKGFSHFRNRRSLSKNK